MAKEFLQILTFAALAFATASLAANDEKSDAALAHVAINVADLSRSEKYYRDVLGFARVWQYPPGFGDPDRGWVGGTGRRRRPGARASQ